MSRRTFSRNITITTIFHNFLNDYVKFLFFIKIENKELAVIIINSSPLHFQTCKPKANKIILKPKKICSMYSCFPLLNQNICSHQICICKAMSASSPPTKPPLEGLILQETQLSELSNGAANGLKLRSWYYCM
jgi:hypothetical protein